MSVRCLRSRVFCGTYLFLVTTATISAAQITVTIAPDHNGQPTEGRAASPANNQSVQNVRFHEELLQTYNFEPHLLNSQQIQQHSAVLDRFWAKAKTQRADYLAPLRSELANLENPPFFLYDGSMLLLSLSDTPADRRIAMAAISHCDLRDVQPKDYFFQVHRFAALNEDTTAAAFRILEQPKFTVFIPQHSLTLGQNYALVYLLLPTNQDYWIEPAIDRLKTERNTTAQESLLLLLWYAQTANADDAIASFVADTRRPTASRNYARQLVNRKDGIPAKLRARASSSSETDLRQKRQERMKAVSDEALIDLDEYTAMLIAKRH